MTKNLTWMMMILATSMVLLTPAQALDSGPEFITVDGGSLGNIPDGRLQITVNGAIYPGTYNDPSGMNTYLVDPTNTFKIEVDYQGWQWYSQLAWDDSTYPWTYWMSTIEPSAPADVQRYVRTRCAVSGPYQDVRFLESNVAVISGAN